MRREIPDPRAARRLIAAGLAGVVAGPVAVALAVTGETSAPPAFFVLVLAIEWGFVGTGLYAGWRWPGSRTGALMVAVGFTWLLSALTARNEPVLYTAGVALDGLWVAVLAHLLLAFPSGRLAGRRDRVLVAAGYVTATVLQVPPYLFSRGCAECPEPLLLVREDAAIADALWALQLLVGLALVVAMAVSLVQRGRAASPVERRPLTPVVWTGGVTIALLLCVTAAELAVPNVPEVVWWLPAAAFVTVPFGFLAGLLSSRLYREAALTALVARLRAIPDPASLQGVLAEALGDPALELAYWARDTGAYVDAAGRPVALPADGAGRMATPVHGPSGPIAAIVHDGGLRAEPELVSAVGSAASLWLQNERLTAELRASRARVVATADAERRRIERDLHDGAQQRLVSLMLQLRLGRRAGTAPAALLDSAEQGMETAVAEMRALAAGIVPPVLADHGLGPALVELTGRCGLAVDVREMPAERLPGPVETTAYFVVSEALTNAVKHARAERVLLGVARRNGSLRIEVRDDGVGGADPGVGSGLRGLAERVAALDGWLTCESAPGSGTMLTAEIPCAS